MPTFQKLADIEVWVASRNLVVEVYRLTRVHPVKVDLGFCDQIRRAALSVSSNIAEGYGRHSDREFARFLHISRGSVLETRSLLLVGRELDYFDLEAVQRLEDDTAHIAAQLTLLSRYLSPASQ